MSPLTLEEIKTHPEVANVILQLEPTSQGKASVAVGRRGGPISIAYEVHGTGPIHLVWITGLNAPRIAWHRQIRYFGHEQGSRFTNLVFDNRGVGDSDTPFARYTTSEMAMDVLELADYLGWAGKKQLNVIGASMGGMIAQELAYLAPERISSLILQSTAAGLVSTLPWYTHYSRRLSMILPKSEAARLAAVKANLFSESWLGARDELGVFPTNEDRFVAEEIWRTRTLKPTTFQGYLLQAFAAAWHYMGPDRLQVIGKVVPYVLVCTGTKDVMVERSHSAVLVGGLSSGGCDVKNVEFDGAGHVLQFEKVKEYNALIEGFTTKANNDTSN